MAPIYTGNRLSVANKQLLVGGLNGLDSIWNALQYLAALQAVLF
jgi:hypothetical protein